MRLLAISFLVMSVLVNFPAIAQNREFGVMDCGTPEEIRVSLERRHHQEAAFWGLVPAKGDLPGSGGILITYAAADGAWTLVSNRPDGRACVIAFGTGLTVELNNIQKILTHGS